MDSVVIDHYEVSISNQSITNWQSINTYQLETNGSCGEITASDLLEFQ